MTDDAADRYLQQALERTLKDRYAVSANELERLTTAAFNTIAEHGRTNAPVRDILRHAGLSSQAFYRYFRSKDELMLIVVARGSSILLAYLEHRASRAPTPWTQVEAWIDGVLRQASTTKSSDRTRPFIIEHERLASEHPVEVLEIEELLMAPLLRAITAGNDAGELTSPSPVADARLIHDMTFAQLRRALHERRPATASERRQIIDFSARALHHEPHP